MEKELSAIGIDPCKNFLVATSGFSAPFKFVHCINLIIDKRTELFRLRTVFVFKKVHKDVSEHSLHLE